MIQLGDLTQVLPAVTFLASQQHLGLTQNHKLHLAAQLPSFLACALKTKPWQEAASDQGKGTEKHPRETCRKLFATHVRETRHLCVDFILEIDHEKNVKGV